MLERMDRPSVELSVEPARGQVAAPRVDFAQRLALGAQAALHAVGAGAAFLPGGAFITAVAEAAADGVGAVAGSEGLAQGVVQGPGGAGDERWALLRAQERLQQEGMANSLRLLTLQRRMQQETEAVNTVSNVMKVRHEMAKAAIQNLRG
ncbi:MAG TPA: hypothetical protein PK668_06375 [Myxococcota bacterium]|nr:hypothetical protein [Myxococcota bacterium]HRY92532.1 hypothetical protein [Myxococcota bacterium]HSA22062.1 hypothetical protein [Myxococcota bacterium]